MRNMLKKIVAVSTSVTMILGMIPISSNKTVKAAENEFDIAVVNFDATLEGDNEEKENLLKMKKYIKEAENEGDEIVLFPEYSLTSSIEDAVDVENDKSVDSISLMAEVYNMYIIFGSMIEEDGKYYSADIICSPDGEVDTYKKMHLSDEEYKEGLSVGDEPYILTTEYGKFGLALGQEFAEIAELGKYYYGSSVRMILVSQSYGYKTGDTTALSQAEYDLYTATYAYLRMYSRYVSVANLYTKSEDTTYFGESHICIGYATSGWIAGCGSEGKPIATKSAGIERGTIAKSSRDSSNGMSSRRLNQLADWYGKLVDYELPKYGEGSKYKDEVNVASVNFHPVWGDLDTNVKLIKDIMKKASEENVELLVFPEMALTGYDVVVPDSYDDELKAKFGNEYMQHVLAQVVRGNHPSELMVELKELAEEYGMYVLIGLPEKDEIDPNQYWNSVAILGKDTIKSYRKVNLASPEPNWSAYCTENDGIFETPFGYVGVAICADIYNYQELQRTYAEMGARIVVNCTAGAASNNCSDGSWQLTYQNRLESFMLRDDNFMITSNLVGYEGPITTSVNNVLDKYGYTVDDMDTTWFADATKTKIFKEVTDLYAQNNNGRLSARTYIFPGASVCIGLDDTTSTGTYVFGNYTNSGVQSNGVSNPYMNITPDTFNQYYGGKFDLSKATLYKFYNDNPYDYRPNLYYKWYTKMFYDTYGYSIENKTFTDEATGVKIYGDELMSESKFSVTKSDLETDKYGLDGYTVSSAKSYSITSEATLTTEFNQRTLTNTNGITTETVIGNITGNYLPYFGSIMVSIPVDKTDVTKVFTNSGEIETEVKDDYVDIELTSDNTITVVSYNKISKPSVDDEKSEINDNKTLVKPTLKAQKITTAKIKTYKASALKKKAVKINLKAKASGKGKLTYKVKSTPKGMKKFITVSKKGVVTLKKKAKKGTYKITITAAAKGSYKKTTKVVSIKVK